MAREVSLLSRSVREMKCSSFHEFQDPFDVLALTSEKRRAFHNNPFVCNVDEHCQAVGVVNGIAVGCEVHFPLLWLARGDPYKVLYGSTTFVAKEYRKTELGLKFSGFRNKVAPSDITGGAGCSQMMLRVLRYWKEPVFLMPRWIMLFKSRSVVETKLRGWLAACCATMIDIGLALYWCVIRMVCCIKLREYDVEAVDVDDSDALTQVANLIASDNHPYAELHDVRWLKWHLSESFTKDGPMSLTIVKKKGAMIGFYMTKIRFHEQASTRGYKNVRLGSIMEWQVAADREVLLPWMLINAAARLRKDVDAVEIVTIDHNITKKLRSLFWKHVGDSNFTFHIYSGPLKGDSEIRDLHNWRLRPAMGDAGLS